MSADVIDIATRLKAQSEAAELDALNSELDRLANEAAAALAGDPNRSDKDLLAHLAVMETKARTAALNVIIARQALRLRGLEG